MQQALIATNLDYPQIDRYDAHTEKRLQRFRSRQGGFARLFGSSLLPPEQLTFDALFFKKLMHFAEKYGYMTHGRLHITQFRRFIRRFHFMLEAYPEEQPIENLGGLHRLPTWIEWDDIRRALDHEDEPLRVVILLNWAERLGMVLEDNNSLLGRAWTIFIMGCILVSVLMIVLGEGAFPARTADFTIIAFTVEYMLKLVAAAGIRRAVLDIDRTLEETIPKPGKDPNGGLNVTGMTAKRIQNFFLMPMNLVDLVSILPWWFQTLMSDTGKGGGLRLSFLRVVRVLRLVRLLKLGSFTQDFQIMSQVFARSAAAISAIALTLCLLSLLFAAVMVQMEPDFIPQDSDTYHWTSNKEWYDTIRPGEDGDVTRAMLWVAGRFTGMQSNLFNKGAVPSNWVNQFLVHILGIMKGFIFLLPLGQMKQFFKDSDNARKEMGLLEYEVYCEHYFEAGDDWSQDKTVPYAVIEVWHDDDALTEEALLSKGTLNLPISIGQPVSDANCLVYMRGREGLCASASDIHKLGLYCEVSWIPEASGVIPECGVLNIRVLHGMGFPAPHGRGWRLRITVPVMLYGGGVSTTLVSEPASVVDQDKPVWDQSVQFNVDWSQIADSHPEAKKFKERQLSIEETMSAALKRQSDSMKRIEESVQAHLDFRRREVSLKAPPSPRSPRTSRSPRY